jgi:GntR family transcriptional regulator
LIEIRPDSDVPIHRQISDGLHLAVSAGRLAPGDEIPSVRAMAVTLRVNPNTVARAYRDLEARGVVETRRGTGTFVARRARAGSRKAGRGVIEARATEFIAAAHQGGMSEREILSTLRRLLREERR